MVGGRYGWQDGPGGVEPGFADAVMMRFGADGHDVDEMEQTPYGAASSNGSTRDEDWLRNLLE